MMTEPEYMAAVNAAVTRWHLDRQGEPLSCVAFADAEHAHCHRNAEVYVAQHGGQVVRGFLVQHPHGWTMVWVMPHSVVRTEAGLVDVTLGKTELRGLAFFPIEGDPEAFTEWAKRYPRESVSIIGPQ